MIPIHVILRSVLLVLICLSCPAAAQTEQLPTAFNVKIAGDSATTRFFIDFDRNLAIKAYYVDQPNRIIIDLDEADFSFGENAPPTARGLISGVQYGRMSKGKSRIVLTLSLPAEIIKASMQKRLDEENFRFLIDMDSTDEETFATLTQGQGHSLGETSSTLATQDKAIPAEKIAGRFKVVLDPGHGGIDGGATGSAGTREKDIVLSFSKLLAERIRASGPYDVKLTREDDTFVALKRRLDFSRSEKADLFISIHADSLGQRFVRGATVYTLSDKASDRLSAQLAAAENRVDLLAGLPVERDVEVVSDILADLTAHETRKFSRNFSNILVTNLQDRIFLIKNPQRSAGFGVLKAPDVPGVLLELGYLSNPEDEKLMLQASWQDKVATAISASVVNFFQLRE